MTEKVIIGGSGGQGVMLLGKILATAAMRENKFVTWLPSYGAEVRGGTAHCAVIISDKEICSPFIDKADTLIMLNSPSLEKFKQRIKNKGLLIFNSSLASKATQKNAHLLGQPFSEIALGLGNIRVANMVALGYFIAKKKILSLKSVSGTFADFAPEEKKGLIEINQRALEEGAKLK